MGLRDSLVLDRLLVSNGSTDPQWAQYPEPNKLPVPAIAKARVGVIRVARKACAQTARHRRVGTGNGIPVGHNQFQSKLLSAWNQADLDGPPSEDMVALKRHF